MTTLDDLFFIHYIAFYTYRPTKVDQKLDTGCFEIPKNQNQMCYVLCRLHQLSFQLSHAVYILSSALISVNLCLYTFCRL